MSLSSGIYRHSIICLSGMLVWEENVGSSQEVGSVTAGMEELVR